MKETKNRIEHNNITKLIFPILIRKNVGIKEEKKRKEKSVDVKNEFFRKSYQFSRVAQLNFRNRATTSRVIKGLMEKNYVERFKLSGNKKEYFLRLTKSGLNLLEHVLPIVVGLRKTGVQHISKKDFSVFLNVLDQIATNYSTNKKSD